MKLTVTVFLVLVVEYVRAQNCPEHRWGPWSDYPACTATCGPEVRCRIRQCFNANNGVVDDTKCDQTKAGSLDCIPCKNPDCPRTGRCSGVGDPHETTFDGIHYDFQGPCNYTYVETCVDDVPFWFRLTARHQKLDKGNGVAVIQQINVQTKFCSVHVDENLKVEINGVPVAVFPSTSCPGVTVAKAGTSYVAIKFEGVDIQFHYAWLVVDVDDRYMKRVCGLCGNFNDDPTDELQMPDQGIAHDYDEFGNSWVNPDPAWPGCRKVRHQARDLPMDGFASRDLAEKVCGPLRNESVFSHCSCLVDYKPFYENCLFDVRTLGDNTQFACDHFALYANACVKSNVDVFGWKEATGCN